jgi:hypothetical protein
MARHQPKRKLTEEDYQSFFDAADSRPPSLSSEQIILLLRKDSPFRWWRLNYDVKWARRRLKRHGLDPNLIRELL